MTKKIELPDASGPKNVTQIPLPADVAWHSVAQDCFEELKRVAATVALVAWHGVQAVKKKQFKPPTLNVLNVSS